jgi:hypothetical protein
VRDGSRGEDRRPPAVDAIGTTRIDFFAARCDCIRVRSPA